MATPETIGEIVSLLLDAPLANKPRPLSDSDTWAAVVQRTTRVFLVTLQDIDANLLRAAAVHHIATEKWFPAVADLRTAALSLARRADDAPDAYTAWQQVKEALRYRDESHMHPLTAKAINALGGIKDFGQSTTDDEGQWRARFIAAFETYQRREAEDVMTLPAVRGYIDQRRQLVAAEFKLLANGRSLESAFDRTPQSKELTHA